MIDALTHTKHKTFVDFVKTIFNNPGRAIIHITPPSFTGKKPKKVQL
jgi:hypothetical protein